MNDGAGTFTAALIPADSDNTSAVAIGDADGDGDFDVVFGNVGQTRLYLNSGNGKFEDATEARLPVDSENTSSVAFVDVDIDGDPDLVLGTSGQQNRLYLNDGAGTFTDVTAARMPVDSDNTEAVAVVDVDGDGDPDLVWGNLSEQNRLYLNDGTGTFIDATAARMPIDSDATQAVAIGDVDGDGDPDLVFGNGGQQNRLYLNDGTGTFTDATATAARMPVGSNDTQAVARGDVDGDGDPDLVFGNSGQQNRLYLDNGTGLFTDVTAARMPVDSDRTWAVALGDVDGDGDPDLVLGNYSQQNRFYVNDGSGTFTDATAALMPIRSDPTRSVALGDVDRDGDLDLVLGNRRQNRLYVNDGTGTFTDVTAARMPVDNDGTWASAVGDVDGDGDLDLVFGNSGQNRLYVNDGTGTFTDATAARMPVETDSARALSLGDVDGDGDADLVFGNYRQQNRLYLNDGTGTFTDVTAARMPVDSDDTRAVALGDVDGDGDPDLVFGNSGQNRLYVNDGTGTFTDATAARMPVDTDFARALSLGDVDGDGDADLVFGNYRQQNRLYLNLLRQLDPPFLLRVARNYQLDVYARYGPPRAVDLALPYLSTGTASIPLPPLGTLGIDPNNAVPLPALLIPASGVASVTIAVPNYPWLAGIPIYGQALLVQVPVQQRLTNVIGDVVWR